jgi:hypothetical protein
MEPDRRNTGQQWLDRLVQAIERAAEAGWPQTARMITMLMVAATALALVMLASRL